MVHAYSAFLKTNHYARVMKLTLSGAVGVAFSFLIWAGDSAPAATPRAWFKADAIMDATNGAVLAVWPDASGNGYHATQATASRRPTFVTGAINGHPVVHFTAASGTLLHFIRPVEDSFTLMIVFRSTQGLGSGTNFYQGAGLVSGDVGGVANDFGTCLFANGQVGAGTGNPDVAALSAAGYNDGRPHLITFKRIRSSGTNALYLDGLPAGTAAGCTNELTAPYSLVIGAQDAGQKHFEGDLAEVKVFKTALSDAERQAEEMELQSKYAIMPTGLATWFKADRITNVADGATLATWPDASGHGNDATQATAGQRPSYLAKGMNGWPAVHFTAAQGNSLNFNRPVQDDFTILCVFRSTQGLGSGTRFYEGAGLVSGEVYGIVNDFGTCLFANGKVCAGTGNPDVGALSADGYNDGRPHLLTFQRTRSTGAIMLYVDGIPAGTATGSTNSLIAPLRLTLGAQQSSGGNNFEGDIAEVQVFNSALSTTNRQTQETGLLTKYGIVPTGLAAWFKAEAITGITNGAAVATWPDASGHNYDATQATAGQRPTYLTNAINRCPVVRFAAANNTSLRFNRPADEDFTMVGVFRSTQGVGSGTYYYQGAGLISGEVYGRVNDFGVCLFANGQVCAGTGNPDLAVLSGGGFNDGRPHVFTFTRARSSGQIALYLDGARAGVNAGSMAPLVAPAQLALGAQQPGGNAFSGDMAEVRIYHQALPDAQRQAVEWELSAKYALLPAAPTQLSVTWQNNHAALVWSGSALAAYYIVKRSTSSGGPYTNIGTATTTSFTDPDAPGGATYYYKVAGMNANGEGPASPPAGVPQPFYTLHSGQATLSIRTNAGGYDIGIQLTNGATLYEQTSPIAVEVITAADPDTWAATWYTAPYAAVKDLGGGVYRCTGSITSANGSRFTVTDTYRGDGGSGMFEIERVVVVAAASANDRGFSTRLAFQHVAAGTMDDYDFFMPGVWYGHNEDSPAWSIAKDSSHYYYWVREDRLPLPIFMLRQKDNGATFSVAHVDPDGRTVTNEDLTRPKVDGRMQFAAIGMQDDRRPLAGVLYPGTEGQTTYICCDEPFARRAHPVTADFTQTYNVAVRLTTETDFVSARENTWTHYYHRFNPATYNCDMDRIYSVGVSLLESYWTNINGVAGVPYRIPLDGIMTNRDDYAFQIGFTGRQTCNGAILVREGLLFGDANLRTNGEQILEFWATNSLTDSDVPRTWYNPFSTNWRHDQTWIRIASDGYLGLLWGWNYENQKGVCKPNWLKTCTNFGDWILSQQAPDGSIPRCWNYDTGEVTDPDTYNTSQIVHYLAELYLATGTERYRAAALAAGEFIYTDTYEPQRYLGGTSGSWTWTVPDKEAASMALRAFLALYDLTREARWLDAATRAAHYYATWIYAWHVPLPADNTALVYPTNRLTTGLSLISAGMSDVDSYAATDAFQVYRLYLLTGDPQLLQEAAMMLYNTKQGLNWNTADDPIPGFGDGIMNEALHLAPIRGQGVGYHFPWQTANYMEPILNFQDVFGSGDIHTIEQQSLAERQAKNHAFSLNRGYRSAQAAPASPAGLTASGGVGLVNLTWNALPAPYYNLKRSTMSGGPYTVIASQGATQFTDTAVTNETTYYYVVAALDVGGESTNSAPVSATPHAPPRLGADFSWRDQQLSLSWPGWATNFTLDSATNLAAPVFWSPVTNLPQASNGRLRLDLPTTNGVQQFFRLNFGP